MLLSDVIGKLSKKQKGTFLKVTWESGIESAASRKRGITVTKQTTATVRWGVSFSKLSKVIQKEATRETPKKETTPWYKHKDGTPYILENLKDSTKTYLQLFPLQRKGFMKTKYFINGVEATKKQVEESGLVNNSKLTHSQDEVLVMTIPTENIKSIGGNK